MALMGMNLSHSEIVDGIKRVSAGKADKIVQSMADKTCMLLSCGCAWLVKWSGIPAGTSTKAH